MKSNLSRISSLVIIFTILILLHNSCKKDPYQVGIKLLPPTDTLTLKTSDTASFVAYSVLHDSVRTDETTLSIIGSIADPVFGTTTAGFYMQYRLSAEVPDFGTNPQLDSIVLQIPYGNFYGDTNALQTLKVYELSEGFNIDSAYYSNRNLQTYPNLLANVTFKPAPHDSVTIYKSKVAPVICVNLNQYSNYFGNKLLTAPASALATNTAFLDFMKGLYIVSPPASLGGALMSFDPTALNSKIVMYFHNAGNDSLHFNFVGNSLCGRFNHFDHGGYATAVPELRQQVLNHDTALGRDNLYVQGLGGIRIRVRMPFLKEFGKIGKIAINTASLELTNVQTDTSLYPVVRLSLVAVDSAGKISFITDANEGSNYFGGYYNKYDRVYRFRISRYMQQVLDGKVRLSDMYIMANDPSTNVLVPNRVNLVGTDPLNPLLSSSKVRLQVIYTRLN